MIFYLVDSIAIRIGFNYSHCCSIMNDKLKNIQKKYLQFWFLKNIDRKYFSGSNRGINIKIYGHVILNYYLRKFKSWIIKWCTDKHLK